MGADISPVCVGDIERAVSILEERITVVDGRLAVLQDERRSLYNALATMRRVRAQMLLLVVEFTS